MMHKLAFAVTLQRSFDSAALEAAARFYGGGSILNPVEKTGGLYVFTDIPVCEITVEFPGMQTAKAAPKLGECLPVCLYEGKGFRAPHGCRLAEFAAKPHERLYIASDENSMRVIESGDGRARLAVRRGSPVGGWLMFKREGGRDEPAFILEKRPPDQYYLLGHSGGFDGGTASRIYVGKADENGVCRIVLPSDFPDTEPCRLN